MLIQKHWIGAASENFRAGRHGKTPEAIVIHIMDGTLSGTAAWFNNSIDKVSAHYGIGKAGQVDHYVAETDTAFHAGVVDHPSCQLVIGTPALNPNYYTIGIEHEGFASDDWPEEQFNSSSLLIAEIARRWGIVIDREHIVAHHEIRASKTC